MTPQILTWITLYDLCHKTQNDYVNVYFSTFVRNHKNDLTNISIHPSLHFTLPTIRFKIIIFTGISWYNSWNVRMYMFFEIPVLCISPYGWKSFGEVETKRPVKQACKIPNVSIYKPSGSERMSCANTKFNFWASTIAITMRLLL